MTDPQKPEPKQTIVQIDAATLTAAIVALLLIPLLAAGFLFQ